jgi:hypothetical protein
MVDLSWVGMRVVRQISYVPEAVRGVRGVRGAGGLAGGSAALASVASAGASVDAVVGMLIGWERARAAR